MTIAGGIFGNESVGAVSVCKQWGCDAGWKLNPDATAGQVPFCVPQGMQPSDVRAIPTSPAKCLDAPPGPDPVVGSKSLLPDKILGMPGQLVVFGGLALAGVALLLCMHSSKPVRSNARKFSLSDADREQWVDNEEGLYRWWKSSRMAKRSFVRAHRKEIDDAIFSQPGMKHFRK
jgi:hypothetical protein